MKIFYLLIASMCLCACDKNTEVFRESVTVSNLGKTRGLVDNDNVSLSNPNLINNWENIAVIKLNTILPNGNCKEVTSPWATGASSFLDEKFRKDIKKEDGWVMLFHTFKKGGLDEHQNYLVFYNQFTSVVKVFYYYEDSRASQGTQWIVKTVSGGNSKLFNLVDYLAIPSDSSAYSSMICSNLSGDPTRGLSQGWNGFQFEIPYCMLNENEEFVIGAFDKAITSYDFSGDIDMSTCGTITPLKNGGGGLLPSFAKVAGSGAKKVIDGLFAKAKSDSENTSASSNRTFGKTIAKAICSISASDYSSLISSGLKLIFGKTTVSNDSEVKLTTTGQVGMTGLSTTETTSGIPPVTFNLYAILNNKTNSKNSRSIVYSNQSYNGAVLGSWNVSKLPQIFYRRISPITKDVHIYYANESKTRWHIDFKVDMPARWISNNSILLNNEIEQYVIDKQVKYDLIRCCKLKGEKYKDDIIDIGEFVHDELVYNDDYNSFFSSEWKDFEISYTLDKNIPFGKKLFFDWGNIDYGKLLCVVEVNIHFKYYGKDIYMKQSRVYPTCSGVDVGCVQDVDWYNQGDNFIVNSEYPYFEEKKRQYGLPIIDYDI